MVDFILKEFFKKLCLRLSELDNFKVFIQRDQSCSLLFLSFIMSKTHTYLVLIFMSIVKNRDLSCLYGAWCLSSLWSEGGGANPQRCAMASVQAPILGFQNGR